MTDILESITVIRNQLNELVATIEADKVEADTPKTITPPLDRASIIKMRQQLVNSRMGVSLHDGLVIGGIQLEGFIEYSNKHPTMTEYEQFDDDGGFIQRLDAKDVAIINDNIHASDWHTLNEIDDNIKTYGTDQINSVIMALLTSAVSTANHHNVKTDLAGLVDGIVAIYKTYDDGDDNGEVVDWCDANGISFDGLQEMAWTYWKKDHREFLSMFIKSELELIIVKSGAFNLEGLRYWLDCG